MPEYLNATQAALEIGISYRTMRRRIDEGKIQAQKGDDGQYSIAVSEVERLKRAQSERPRPARSGQIETGQERTDLEQRVTDLEQKVRTLEAMIGQAHMPLVATGQQKTTVDIAPKTKPTKKPSTRKSDLPEGCILVRDFARQHGIAESTMRDHLLYGLGPGLIGYSTDVIPQKEMIEYSERPKPGRPKEKERFFNLEQQEQAVFLLRKHGKLS